MQTSDLQKVYSRKKNLVIHEENEFGLLFDMETGKIHKIGRKAKAAWNLIDGRKTGADIITLLKKEYGESALVSEDVLHFLSELEQMGYIENVDL